MKNQKKATMSKLIERFDNELRNLLLTDLKTVKAKKGLLSSIQQGINGRLSAA